MIDILTPTTSSFASADGLNVFYRNWKITDPKAIVVFAHGFNSHSGYFQWTAEQLNKENLEVYALDWQGRGNSDGERYYIADYNAFVKDLDHLVEIVKTEHPDLQIFLMGHSAGGVLSAVYTLDHQQKLSGFICESFAFQVPAPEFALAVLKGLSHVFPHAHVLKLKNEDFSRDKAVVDFMNHDPLIANEVQPTKTVQQLVLADERLKKEMANINLPVLILHGTGDKATKPEGSQFFYEQAASSDKTLKLYKDHYHDLLNDLEKETVMGDVISWLNAHVK
ncbi:alpha-beta hydrolase superfamily lysophospholipase [Chitinophaga dinghuensis]|uniref:Monoacylglycerol lipase n=1 Tax=Chitinophaga dinghuensis TaxID=1539050 RepID=A0A327VMS1_9BACT|nr:alpha/beta hydrolase [Chitinophaga dinghuensis]RAJ76655.1 alpha-beta hydrolase superfamily lysophospholipase [Chitinophaga dinghuensis]